VSLFRLRERRANLEDPAVPINEATILAMYATMANDAGVVVNQKTSMKMAGVYRATSLISGLGGALPIKTLKVGTKQVVKSALIGTIHPEMTDLEFWRLTYVQRCLWGNFFAQKVRGQDSKRVKWLNPIHASSVTVKHIKPVDDNPTGKVFDIIDDHGHQLPLMGPNEIFHLPHLSLDGRIGLSPVMCAAQAIGLSMGAEKYSASLFGRGNLLSGLLQTDHKLNQGQAERLQARWTERFSGNDGAHKIAIIDAGAKFQSLTMPSNEAQLLESRDFQVSEIGRYFGVPPYLMMQTDKTTSWGSGLEQQARGFTQFDLWPMWLAPTEQRITKELLARGQEARYDQNLLLRGDSMARANYYAVLREAGVLNANDIRYLEDMPPVPDGQGGDSYIQPALIDSGQPLGSDKILGGYKLQPKE
jgi:HK97 family phage portal protein